MNSTQPNNARADRTGRTDRIRGLARLTLANRVSAVYLTVVGGAMAVAAAQPLRDRPRRVPRLGLAGPVHLPGLRLRGLARRGGLGR